MCITFIFDSDEKGAAGCIYMWLRSLIKVSDPSRNADYIIPTPVFLDIIEGSSAKEILNIKYLPDEDSLDQGKEIMGTLLFDGPIYSPFDEERLKKIYDLVSIFKDYWFALDINYVEREYDYNNDQLNLYPLEDKTDVEYRKNTYTGNSFGFQNKDFVWSLDQIRDEENKFILTLQDAKDCGICADWIYNFLKNNFKWIPEIEGSVKDWDLLSKYISLDTRFLIDQDLCDKISSDEEYFENFKLVIMYRAEKNIYEYIEKYISFSLEDPVVFDSFEKERILAHLKEGHLDIDVVEKLLEADKTDIIKFLLELHWDFLSTKEWVNIDLVKTLSKHGKRDLVKYILKSCPELAVEVGLDLLKKEIGVEGNPQGRERR